MSTIPTGVNFAGATVVNADDLDLSVEDIRGVIDADGAIGGLDSVNLNAATNFRLDQTAEPASRMSISVPLPDINASITELAPFSIRVYAVCPINARLARASVGWRNITVVSGNSYIALTASVMGYPLRPSGTSFGVPGSGGVTPNAQGLQTILQTINDLKFMQFVNRPTVTALQPIPIDVSFDFDGSSFTMQGFRILLELNAEHSK